MKRKERELTTVKFARKKMACGIRVRAMRSEIELAFSLSFSSSVLSTSEKFRVSGFQAAVPTGISFHPF